MKRKKSLKTSAAILAAFAILMFCICPVVTMKVNGELYGDKGFEAIKGAEGMKPTYMLIVPLVLALAGIVLAVLSMKGQTTMTWAAVGCFAVAALLFFLTRTFYVSANEEMLILGMDKMVKLGQGAIYAGIACAGSALCTLLSVFLKDKE